MVDIRSKTVLCVLVISSIVACQPSDAIYDEAKAPAYTLPDPLIMSNGELVTNAETWRTRRRPEILEMFETLVFGRSPAPLKEMAFETISTDKQALDGKAVRKQVSVYFSGKKDGPKMDILIYLPSHANRPVPLFVALNFMGNHSIHPDPGITLSNPRMNRPAGAGAGSNQPKEIPRGMRAGKWPVEMILARGYGLATAYYGDIDPDFDDGFQNGVHPLFYAKGETKPAAEEWGSIAAWAWGLSRAMDYFETDDEIDHEHVAVMGHSRLGKTALWAGASDTRFALVISNESGCGGAALSRRQFGETVKRINTAFPHWFCDNFNKYNDNEDTLPVDQHMLVALMAPRPVYVASAEEDLWSDPRGEFLSAKHADPVYRILGMDGLGVEEMPAIGRPVGSMIGYHIRAGKHDVTGFDWQQYLDFADKHFGGSR